MGLLWLVTLIWAFSFSLIGEFLSGRVDPYLAVSSRMLLALVLFLPWLLKSTSSKTQAMALAAIGAMQLGADVPAAVSQFPVFKCGRSAVIYYSDPCLYLNTGLLLALQKAAPALVRPCSAGYFGRFSDSLSKP